ncbi:MAG: hypothetical protein PUD09_05655 [Coriobacteriales bacterium]|nr:hypothetical protein [Coriobacteriales bacterium]
MRACPSIKDSTREERLQWVHERYVCIADCDQCGICESFHGQDPEHAFADYIEGRAEMLEVASRYRR